MNHEDKKLIIMTRDKIFCFDENGLLRSQAFNKLEIDYNLLFQKIVKYSSFK